MSLPVAVLAGGLSTRLRPLTEHVPKILIEVAGRPFAEHQLELLRRQRITRVVYCLGYLGQQVVDELGDGTRWGMEFTYVFDGARPLGTGGALKLALATLGDAFFVMYGDSYLQCDFNSIESVFRSGGKSGLMTVFRNQNRWGRSNIEYAQGRIRRYDKLDWDPTMQYIDYGLSILTPKVLDPWSGTKEAFDIAAVYRNLIENDDLIGYEVADRFYEIGSVEGLEETRALLEANEQATK